MKRIGILFIFFLVVSFCGGDTSSTVETTLQPIEQGQQPQGKPSPEYCKDNQDDPACQGGPQGKQPQGQQPQGQQPQGQQPQGKSYSDEERQAAIDIVKGASEELNNCFENGFGKIYEEILKGYIPDDYEVAVILTCNSNPNAYSSSQGQQGQGQQPQDQSQQPQGQGQPTQGQDPKRQNEGYYDLKVTLNDSSYTKATSSSNTTFGQTESADIILSDFGFNTTGGPLKFNHPVSVASDGNKLVVVDRFNNRALIWNSIPNSNTPPDIVLGQNNF